VNHDAADWPTAGSEQRRRDALAHQLHVVIRHRSPREPLANRLVERARVVVDELARAARITSRVWSEALHAATSRSSRDR